MLLTSLPRSICQSVDLIERDHPSRDGKAAERRPRSLSLVFSPFSAIFSLRLDPLLEIRLFIQRKSARKSLHFYSQGNFFAEPKEQKSDGSENANSPNSVRIRKPVPPFIRICSPVIIQRQRTLDDFFNSFNAQEHELILTSVRCPPSQM